MSVRFLPSAARELEHLAKHDPEGYRRIKEGLQRFAETGRGDIKRARKMLRLRIGDWRVYLGAVGGEYYVLGIPPRSIAYRHELLERMMRRLEGLKRGLEEEKPG